MGKRLLNLYLISQDANDAYDTYDSAVVAAKDTESAKHIHPGGVGKTLGGRDWWETSPGDYLGMHSWTQPTNVKVKLVGKSCVYEPKVICASFNAG